MTTLTVVSDLHLEARPLNFDEILDPDLVSDVLCLLGDIGDPSSQSYRDFLTACAQRFPVVLLLAGNNEYRNHDGGCRTMAQTEALIRAAAAAHPNVHFLQNATYEHKSGVLFVGTTLWSHLPDTPLPPPSEECAVAAIPSSKGGSCSEIGHSDGAAETPVAIQHPILGLQRTAIVPRPDADSAPLQVKSTSSDHLAAAYPYRGVGNAVAVQAEGIPQQRIRHPSLPLPQLPQLQQSHPNWAAPAGRCDLPVPISVPPRTSGSEGIFNFEAYGRVGGGLSSARLPRVGRAGCRQGAGATPRFASYSQPDWVTMPEYGSPCNFVISGCSCIEQCSGGADDRGCRRRRLRHCVSLAALRPDEPCPSWRAMQSGCRADSGSARSSSSSGGSDGSGSASEGGSGDSSNDASDVEPSALSVYSVGGVDDQQRPSQCVEDAAAGETPPALMASPATCLGEVAVSDLPGVSMKYVSISQPMSALGYECAQTGISPAVCSAWQPVPELTAAFSDSIPAFLSDPGTIGPTKPSGSICANMIPRSTTAADATASNADYSSSHDASNTHTTTTTPASVHRHHNHNHSHNRHSHSSSHAHNHHRHAPPPPSTISEFIGATSLDFRRIFATPGGAAITPEYTNELFRSSLEFVRANVTAALGRGLIPIVLSHHAPSMRGTSRPAFAGHPSTHAYSTDLEPYLAGSGVAAWYCGHTHYNFDLELPGSVRLASNQFGSQPKPADGYSRVWQHTLPSVFTTTTCSRGGYSSGILMSSSKTLDTLAFANMHLSAAEERTPAAAAATRGGSSEPGFGANSGPRSSSASAATAVAVTTWAY